jgi:hypothetical protein
LIFRDLNTFEDFIECSKGRVEYALADVTISNTQTVEGIRSDVIIICTSLVKKDKYCLRFLQQVMSFYPAFLDEDKKKEVDDKIKKILQDFRKKIVETGINVEAGVWNDN